MEQLRLHIPGHREHFGQKIGGRDLRFLHLAAFDSSIARRNFTDDHDAKLIGQAKDRPENLLILAPGGGDLVHRFIPSFQSLAQHAADHEQRNHHHQDERSDAEQFDDGAVLPPEGGLRFCERGWHLRVSHARQPAWAHALRQ